MESGSNKFYHAPNPDFDFHYAESILNNSLCARAEDIKILSSEAIRLFNGFYEGVPGLVIDRYQNALVIKNFARNPAELKAWIEFVISFYTGQCPELNTILLKTRHAKNPEERQGVLLKGSLPTQIQENGVNYALDLQLNQDDSFYIDTRNLRIWLKEKMSDKTVLNTFAYTGALGVAALAGNARHVTQTDLSPKFLQLAKKAERLNTFKGEQRLLPGDFFKQMAMLKSQNQLFDCVIIDPPLFSKTAAGEVSLLKNWLSLVNKARPSVAHEGYLVLINNALFLSGEALQNHIQEMCSSGYMDLHEIIDIPRDVTGYPETIVSPPPVATAPYNHPTKISITRVRRKDGKRAS